MQQEDDLRGLAKVMAFMRALSILFVVINIYWFCYGAVKEWDIDIGVVVISKYKTDNFWQSKPTIKSRFLID